MPSNMDEDSESLSGAGLVWGGVGFLGGGVVVDSGFKASGPDRRFRKNSILFPGPGNFVPFDFELLGGSQ